jgi:hypothetical protein
MAIRRYPPENGMCVKKRKRAKRLHCLYNDPPLGEMEEKGKKGRKKKRKERCARDIRS